MSRLAYFRFEGSVDLEERAQSLAEETDSKKVKKILKKLLSEKELTAEDAKNQLSVHLESGEFVLRDVFNQGGTQAFLAYSDKFKINVLAFRGTEKKIEDIKIDLKAAMVEMNGDRIHSGFYQAFRDIRKDIEGSLQGLKKNGYPLYLTGHSLGGALALMATKYLADNSVGACYTFGSPRVASISFSDSIKTPIYRVVNASDGVPRIPPAHMTSVLSGILEVIKIPYISQWLIRWLDSVSGYRHHGDMRYLTGCRPDYSDLQLLHNPPIIDRAVRMLKRMMDVSMSVPITDHSIETYSAKLSYYAGKRCLGVEDEPA
ncbi:lipase family protein [Sansalvadorimonas sp. 2012CJ34-2]|uniref:Lipase family protein n=1 Tax=Parendozoicomonas callyspongiae TaxID=2942213 RepID=A0ABT0PJX0_9GAMM|nr:lipase family protein [Sansalvadorimonas sp. 2012CJ34-2]MCL6271685.1 lipase family protein [Sansalvadorimonas sp. 2012CJ34-2]